MGKPPLFVGSTKYSTFNEICQALFEIWQFHYNIRQWHEHFRWYILIYLAAVHFSYKLAKGETHENIAKFIGVTPNYIERPKVGRYAYDNMLSNLIHIKYPRKYQYNPQEVITLTGKGYIEYFRESHRRWMHGRAERIIAETQVDLKDIKIMIINDELTRFDLMTKPEYKYVYQLHKGTIDTLLVNHKAYTRQQEKVLRDPDKYKAMFG